jgi:hypothetical protein
MDRNGIVDALERQRRVERLAQLYAERRLDDDLKDLCQIVYLHLLQMDEDKLRDLWDTGDIDFYLRRVIKTQLFGNRSDYEREVLRFRKRSMSIDDCHGI